jgi:hypothetical protein
MGYGGSMKYILIRDVNIEGNCVRTYFCKNQNDKEMFVICGKDVAYRFNTPCDAGIVIDRLATEKGFLKNNMKIVEADKDASMVMPL